MTRNLLNVGLIASFILWVGSGGFLFAQEQWIIFLLPEHFSGWACVDFGVAAAPPLPREGKTLVVRPRIGEVLKTSDEPNDQLFLGSEAEAWFEIKGQRLPLPKDVHGQQKKGDEIWSDSELGIQHYCAFYGTADEKDAAADPPGFPRARQDISPEERVALVDLYNATGGDHWDHHVGWLGHPGTECHWHGVECRPQLESGKLAKLTGLDLSENNLVGTIPQTVGQLVHLEALAISGNHISGLLPRNLIDRWLDSNLAVDEVSVLTNISKIEVEWDPGFLMLCNKLSRKTTLSSDGRASLIVQRCRNATHRTAFDYPLSTFCEITEGRVSTDDFAKLAWLIEKDGFFDLERHFDPNLPPLPPLPPGTDRSLPLFYGIPSPVDKIRVTRDGETDVVRSDNPGPYRFRLWSVQRAIEGVAASLVEWKRPTTRSKCPKGE